MTGIWGVAFVFLWVVVIIEAFLLFATMRQVGYLHAQVRPAGFATGTRAPSFQFPDSEGSLVRLADRGAKWALLFFLSPTCEPCHAIVPHVNHLYMHDPDVFVAVITQAGVAENARFREADGIASPVLSAAGSTVWRNYGVPGTPALCVVNREGVISAGGNIHDLPSITKHLEVGGYRGAGSVAQAVGSRS